MHRHILHLSYMLVLLHDPSIWDPAGRSSPNVALLSPWLRERMRGSFSQPMALRASARPVQVMFTHTLLAKARHMAKAANGEGSALTCRETPPLLDRGQGCVYDLSVHREGNKEKIDCNDFTRVCLNHLSDSLWNRPGTWCVLFTH